MKALSISSGYAHLIIFGDDEGHKEIECRTWQTSHRGPLLICSNRDVLKGTISRHAIGAVDLVDVRPFTRKDIHAACMEAGDYEKGLYAWILKNPRVIYPFPVKGIPGLFEVDDSLIRYVDDTEEAADEYMKSFFNPLVSG